MGLALDQSQKTVLFKFAMTLILHPSELETIVALRLRSDVCMARVSSKQRTAKALATFFLS